MKNFLKGLLFYSLLAFGLQSYASMGPSSLKGKTITMTDKTGKILLVKTGNKVATLNTGESKIFDFESMKGAEVGFQGSVAPYRPLSGSTLASIATAFQRTDAKNVNVDLIPGTVWSAKIANISYGPPTKDAKPAYLPAR